MNKEERLQDLRFRVEELEARLNTMDDERYEKEFDEGPRITYDGRVFIPSREYDRLLRVEKAMKEIYFVLGNSGILEYAAHSVGHTGGED